LHWVVVRTGAAARDTAARISALMRHVFLYDRGNQLRVLEDTGLAGSRRAAPSPARVGRRARKAAPGAVAG